MVTGRLENIFPNTRKYIAFTLDGVGLKPASVSATTTFLFRHVYKTEEFQKNDKKMFRKRTGVPIKHLTLKQHIFNKSALSPFFCLNSMNGSRAYGISDKKTPLEQITVASQKEKINHILK